MAEQNYPVPQNPVYNTEIRALQDSDPASASTIFNPLIKALIGNTHFLKLLTDALEKVAFSGSASDLTSGTLTIARGGTGGTTAAAVISNLGVVPATRKVNNKPLNADIALNSSDVGAAPTSHNHSADNITSGTLTIARGGTGGTTIASARNALGLGNATGAIPIANGGTGQTSIAAARNAFGLGNTTGAVPVANGGTGASNAADARNNLRMKRTLWDGKWSTGSITVNELSDYRIFALTIEGFATRLLVFNTGSNFRGEGGYALSDGQIETMFFNATVNGNVLTYVAGTYTRMAATGNSFTRYGAKSLVVTNIQGLL